MARKDELEEMNFKDLEYKCLAFPIRLRNDYYYDSFTGSPMSNLGLDLACSFMSTTFQLTSLLDAKKELIARIKKCIEELVETRTYFRLLETLPSNKTKG